jgi:hypothetical protein
MTRRNRFRPGSIEIFPRSSAPFVADSLPDPAIVSPGLPMRSSRTAAITDRSVGTVADHESAGSASDSDFLDLQGPGSLLVAAPPRQRRLHVRGSGAQFLPDDVTAGAPSRNPRLSAEENPRVSDPDDLAEENQSRMYCQTCRISAKSAGHPVAPLSEPAIQPCSEAPHSGFQPQRYRRSMIG